MVKRSRTESNDYETIAKKFRRLERKLLSARRKERDRVQTTRKSSSSSSSSCSSSTSSCSSSGCSRSSSARRSAPSRPPAPPADHWLCIEDVPPREYVPEPSTSAAAHVPPPPLPQAPPPLPQPPPPSTPLHAVQPSSPTAQTEAPAETTVDPCLPVTTTQLNDELLLLLGEDPSQKKAYGKEIQPDLAIRLQHMTTTGLPKEVRKELMDKYLPPVNCPLIDAPILNAEVKAAVSEAVFKRDKGIEQKQKQIAAAITCIADALTLLLSSEQTDTGLIKLLMDAQKLLCDIQNADSLVRRNFVLFNLKKELKDQLQTTKIDKFLFSEELADTLKAAKAISKSGADMKPAAPTKQPPKKAGANKQQKNNLNWRVPPQNHRSKGIQRNKGPVSRSRPETSSRHSSRPSTSRSHR